MIKPGLVRFILASLVVLFHITKFVFIGPLAVYCFFILSGYWVSLMYENKYSKKKNPLLVFYGSRILRLGPVFYLISIFTIILSYFYKPESLNFINTLNLNTILFWFSNIFILGYNYLRFQPLVPAWSLDIELQFYLLLPFLFLLMKSKKNRFIVIAISLLLSLVFFIFCPDSFLSKTIIKYLIYFLIGVLIFKSKIKFNYRIEMGFNFLFLIVLLIHYIVPNLFNLIKNTSNSYSELFNIVVSFLLIPFLTNSVLKKSNEKDMLLGGMSYTLYLCHWMFIIPYNFYIKDISKFERIPYTILYLIVVYFISFLIYKYFDNPIDIMRKKWVNNSK